MLRQRRKIRRVRCGDEKREKTPILFRSDLAGNCRYLNAPTAMPWDDGFLISENPSWLEAAHPLDKDDIRAEWDRCAAAGAPFSAEFRLGDDRNLIWILAHASPEAPSNGSGVTHYVGTLTDITYWKNLEEAQLRQEVQHQEILESLPITVFECDEAGVITFINQRGLEVIGYSADDLVGKMKVTDTVVEEDREQVQMGLVRLVRGEKIPESEFTILRKDGSTFPAVVDSAPIFIDDRVIGFRGFIYDITARKIAEQEERRLEFQMQQTQKLESLGVLGGGIAHDFNNLLMGILGNVSLALLDMPEDIPTHTHLLGIEQAAERAAELCKQLLAYSGKGKFVVKTLDINEVIREIAHLVDVSISKKARLTYDCDESMRPVEADASQIRQIVMNLIINASEALSSEEGVIRVSTDEREHTKDFLAESRTGENPPEGTYACIEVSDTGCGMDEDALEKIFDPFYTTKFTGRGLGLAAVLGIVRSHGGAIHVDSTLDGGTTFLISLPISSKHLDRAPADKPKKINWSGVGTILLVDDEPIVRNIGKEMLDHVGFSVLLAADGAEGIEVYRKNIDTIDLVLLDMTMPRLSGEEVFKEMVQLRADIPIVISSGYNEPHATESFPEPGPAGFLQKPYGAGNLYAIIRQVLEGAPTE